jgi:hypothetical protein
MDKGAKESVDRVNHYLEDAERKHWIEMGKPENHIYRDILQLQSWLAYTEKQSSERLKREILKKYMTRRPTPFVQIDAFLDGFDDVVRPNDHGVALMAGSTFELMSGVCNVRILIKPDTPLEKITTALTDAADWLRRHPALMQDMDPTRVKYTHRESADLEENEESDDGIF